jgi:[ribosomal protein S18]-alanine N-acetyltransferase
MRSRRFERRAAQAAHPTQPPAMDDEAQTRGDDLSECRLVRPEDAVALGGLFERLRRQGAEAFFHPHPLTREAAAELAVYAGRDVYCVRQIGEELVGYGMLRGWEEGFEVPSLGLAIEAAHQGRGHGRCLMEFMHELARQRGAKRIRLRVYPDNVRAVTLYQSLGYSFNTDCESDGQIVGFLELSATEPSRPEEPTK